MDTTYYKRKPRILLVANVAKEHVLKFHIPTVKLLYESGWHIDIACAGSDKIPYCSNRFVMSYKRSPFNLAIFKGISELADIVNKGNYDIVYCHTPVGGLAARIAARKARKSGTKVVYFAHGYHFFKGAPKQNWIIYYPIEKAMSLITDAIILINREDYELTKCKFSKCKAYLLNGVGVDTSRFNVANRDAIRANYRKEMNIPDEATVLIYLAELLPNKNQTFLLRVLKHVLKKDENVHLVLAGFDHSNGAFQRYVEKVGVKEHVHFLGWREDVGNLYAMSDICTATSIREGFGLNLVEAMACGIPVIATRNRGHETIITDGKNGFLIDLGDEEVFAERILQLINDQSLRRQFVKNGQQEQTRYSSGVVTNEIKKILEEYLPVECFQAE